MAQTIPTLIANGQEIFDETVEGANTHERVGGAIKEIPLLMAEPMDLLNPNAEWFFQVAWGTGTVALAIDPALNGRVPSFFLSAFGWPYVTGTGVPPNNTGFARIATAGPETRLSDLFLDMFSEVEALFGNLEAANGRWLWIMPTTIDQYGREIRYKPIRTLIQEEP